MDSKDCVAIAFSRNVIMVFFGMFIAGGMMQGLMMQKQRQEGPMVPSGMRKSWHMLQTMVSKLLLIFVVSFLPPSVNHFIDIVSNLVKIQRNCKEKNRFFFLVMAYLVMLSFQRESRPNTPKLHMLTYIR